MTSLWSVADEPVVVLGRATTDRQGRYEVGITEGKKAGLSRFFLVIADHPGFAVAYTLLFQDYRRPPGDLLRLTLGPPLVGRFEVRDPEGRPAVGAQVGLYNPMLPAELRDRIAVTTDAQGRAMVPDLMPGGPYARASVTSAAFGRQSVPLAGAEGGRVAIQLGPVGRLTGRVVADGPAQVRGLRVSGTASSPRGPRASFAAETDAQGRFEVPDLLAGTVNIASVLAPSPSPYYATATNGIRVEAGGWTEVEIPLKHGARVRGVVREAGSGRPLAHAALNFAAREPGKSLLGSGLIPFRVGLVADEHGRFEATMPPGLLHYYLAGAMPFRLALDVRPTFEVPPGADRFEAPPIEVRRARDLRGTVVGEDGRPLSGALVELLWAGWDLLGSNRRVETRILRTDGRGAFLFRDAASDAECRLQARTAEGCSVSPAIVAAGVDAAPVTLRVSRAEAGRLVGRVVDDSGEPVPDVEVYFLERVRLPGVDPEERHLVPVQEGSWNLMVRTDAAGCFQSPRCLRPGGEYLARASAPVRGVDSAWVRIGPGQEASVGNLRFTPPPPPPTVERR